MYLIDFKQQNQKTVLKAILCYKKKERKKEYNNKSFLYSSLSALNCQ